MKRSNIPPHHLIEYRPPHSPFQKLIDSRREFHGLSNRELAEKIGVSQSTLWIWLHNVNGYPHPKSFKSQHLTRLARVLEISESQIKTALDASRQAFVPSQNTGLDEAFQPLRRFIEIVENDKRETLSKYYVLDLAKNICASQK